MELQPESDAQAAIVPTQFIVHSIAAPWTVQRIYEYWRDSTNLESHFGLAYDGDLGQFIGTQTRADANMYANVRAVSLESASNLDHTDPWTDAQIEAIVKLGVWLHHEHGIPLQICPAWDAPGYGFHRMYSKWSDGGTACPGDARVEQFNNIVFPEIVRRANGGASPAPQSEDVLDMDENRLRQIIREEASGQVVRDANAFAIAWFLDHIVNGVPVDGNPWGGMPDSIRNGLKNLVAESVKDLKVDVNVNVNK